MSADADQLETVAGRVAVGDRRVHVVLRKAFFPVVADVVIVLELSVVAIIAEEVVGQVFGYLVGGQEDRVAPFDVVQQARDGRFPVEGRMPHEEVVGTRHAIELEQVTTVLQ